MLRSLLKGVSHLLIAVMLFYSLVNPVGVAWAQSNSGQITRKLDSGDSITFPKLAWQELGRFTPPRAQGGGWNLQGVSGDRLAVYNDRTALALKTVGEALSAANTTSNAIANFGSAPAVLGSYTGVIDGKLRIDVYRTVKLVTGDIVLMTAVFTPAHGGAWAAAGATGLKQRIEPTQHFFDPNPLGHFVGRAPADDPLLFHGIGPGGVQFAMGLAMRQIGAATGFLHWLEPSLAQTQTKGGNFLRKSVTTTITGSAKPTWYVVTPARFQPHGTGTLVCAVETQQGVPCPAAELPSLVHMDRWDGALPEEMTEVYKWSQTKKSFTILAFALFIFIATWGIGALMGAGAGAGAGATAVSVPTTAGVSGVSTGLGSYMGNALATLTAGGATTGITTLVGAAVADGVGHLALNMLATGRGATAPQRGLYGSVGDGRLIASPTPDTHTAATAAKMGTKLDERFDLSYPKSAGLAATGGCGAHVSPDACTPTGAVLLPRENTHQDPLWGDLVRDTVNTTVRNLPTWAPEKIPQ